MVDDGLELLDGMERLVAPSDRRQCLRWPAIDAVVHLPLDRECDVEDAARLAARGPAIGIADIALGRIRLPERATGDLPTVPEVPAVALDVIPHLDRRRLER